MYYKRDPLVRKTLNFLRLPLHGVFYEVYSIICCAAALCVLEPNNYKLS